MADTTSNHEEIIRQFSIQAAKFSSAPNVANRENLEWMLNHLPLKPTDRVLDVAAGTGSLSRGLAPRVAHVTAYDLTPAMLEQGQLETAQAGITNISFEQGKAESMPYADGQFDLTAVRLAIHHFTNPRAVMAQMARVTKPGGHVAIIDIVSSENAQEAETYNEIERLRDPSHTVALPLTGLHALMAELGLRVITSTQREVPVNMIRWFDLAQTPEPVRVTIRERILRDLRGEEATGTRPVMLENELWFTHTWAVVVGAK